MIGYFRILTSLRRVAFALLSAAQSAGAEPPDELLPFIPTDAKYLAHAVGDLNGDGRQDYVLVVEKQTPNKPGYVIEEHQRPLFIIIRQLDGSLVSRKGNERIVFCDRCGGVFGDPFASLTAGKNTFTVQHYGGSAWRWGFEYQFDYSRRDDTWQLVRVEELSFHISDPEKAEVKIYRPPHDFGLIDIADFDPGNFQGVGKQ
ncbi:MAG: hypothetical protein LBE22_00535 [Azoarcus sp.]|jgi:hypothetical protein|nr:hypothetical protein [Azoarcus sp.]